MIILSQSYLLISPVETVYAYISDARNQPHWQSACDAVELSSVSTARVGARYRSHCELFGRKWVFEVEVTASDAPYCYAYRTVSGPRQFTAEYHLARVGNGTQIDWTFFAEVHAVFGILPRPLLKRALLRQFDQDIGCLRRVLGAQGALRQPHSALASG